MPVSTRAPATGWPQGPRSKNPLVRLLWLDGQLRANRYPTARALAEHFEMDIRTAYRDVEFGKDQLNLPITYDPTRRGYCYSEPVAPLAHVSLTEGDLVALYISQRVLEQYRGTDFGARLAHAFEKLSALMPDTISIDFASLREGFSFYVGAPLDLDIETQLFARASEAVTRQKPLTIEYYTQSRGELSRRTVDPYHLHNHTGAWYLIGHDHKSRQVRTFHLSRVRKAWLQERRFERRADFDLKAYLREGFSMMRGETVEQVSIRFDADQAPWVAERRWHPTERRERHRDGSLTLHLELSGLFGVKRWVLSYGAHAEVLAPESLRREVAAEARRLASAYRRP